MARLINLFWFLIVCWSIYTVDSCNLALRKQVFQSVNTYSRSMATNGIAVPNSPCTMKGLLTNWLYVDLGRIYPISSVAVFSPNIPTDHNFTVTVYKTDPDSTPANQSQLCGMYPKNVPDWAWATLDCTPGVVGRYVKVQKQGAGSLSWCEIEVYGRDKGSFRRMSNAQINGSILDSVMETLANCLKICLEMVVCVGVSFKRQPNPFTDIGQCKLHGDGQGSFDPDAYYDAYELNLYRPNY